MRSKFSFPLRFRFRLLYLVSVLSLTLFTSRLFGQTVTTVYDFGVHGPNYPGIPSPWTQGRNGMLYGTLEQGCSLPNDDRPGCFVRFDPSTQKLTIYYGFREVFTPYSVVMLGSDNYFYGTGTYELYRITLNGIYTTLHTLCVLGGCYLPGGPPIEATDGNLYGTANPTNSGDSIIYKFTRDGVFSVVYTFDPATSGMAAGALMQGSDGKLYVTASWGGAKGCGTVVKVALYGGLLATHDFDCSAGGSSTSPAGPLTLASDGNYYGVTTAGGTYGFGTLYQLTPEFGVTTLYNFGASPTDGISPNGGLVQGTDGNLYGTTYGNADWHGHVSVSATLFQWSLSSGYRQLYRFPDSIIRGGLMQHTNGLFYGSTGVMVPFYLYSLGDIFSLDMGLGPFVALVRRQGKVGSNAQILGQGLTGTSSVTFNGIAATSFTVVSDTYMTAVVPTGATTGPIVVTSPTGSLKSNRNFTVTP